MCAGVLAPFFLAIDAANVSSRADNLMKCINNLRLDWASTERAKEVHSRVYPLQVTLKELNHGQGLGFTVFTSECRVALPQFSFLITMCTASLSLGYLDSVSSCSRLISRAEVIDKKTLNLLAISITSFFATVIPLIMAFVPDPPSYDGGVETCIDTKDALRICGEISQAVGDVEGQCILRNATLDELLRAGGH